jgi:hypothetical protein
LVAGGLSRRLPHRNLEPDPILLAYNVTYENMRADLKQVAG